MSEEHPAAANRGAKYSAFHDTVPYACGGLITPSANDRGSRAEAGGSRGQGLDPCRGFFRFPDEGKHTAIQLQRLENLGRPFASRHIEKQCSGGVGNFGGKIAREAKSDVVLRKEQCPHPAVIVGLAVSHPQKLRHGEAGKRGVARNLLEPRSAHPIGEPVRLCLAALVAPDNGGPDDLMRFIEKDSSVHLS